MVSQTFMVHASILKPAEYIETLGRNGLHRLTNKLQSEIPHPNS